MNAPDQCRSCRCAINMQKKVEASDSRNRTSCWNDPVELNQIIFFFAYVFDMGTVFAKILMGLTMCPTLELWFTLEMVTRIAVLTVILRLLTRKNPTSTSCLLFILKYIFDILCTIGSLVYYIQVRDTPNFSTSYFIWRLGRHPTCARVEEEVKATVAPVSIVPAVVTFLFEVFLLCTAVQYLRCLRKTEGRNMKESDHKSLDTEASENTVVVEKRTNPRGQQSSPQNTL